MRQDVTPPGQYPNYPVPGPSDPGYANASMERVVDNLFTQSPPGRRTTPKLWPGVAVVATMLAVCTIMLFV